MIAIFQSEPRKKRSACSCAVLLCILLSMENYFARLLLSSELDDPVYFAHIHDNIAKLEKKLVAHFNEHGPMNQHYVVLMGELNMAYYSSGDTSKELEVAQELYQICVSINGEESELTLEALIALASSYLDDGQIEEAQGIASTLLQRNWTTQDETSYDLYIDALCLQADIHHAKEEFHKELTIREHVLSIFEEFEGSASNQAVTARCARAFCLEKLKRWKDALSDYRIIRAYLDVETDFATEAEKLGLLVHIGRCYRKMGNFSDSHAIFQWAYKDAVNRWGAASSPAKKLSRIIGISQANQT